jgi:hypothetical protein
VLAGLFKDGILKDLDVDTHHLVLMAKLGRGEALEVLERAVQDRERPGHWAQHLRRLLTRRVYDAPKQYGGSRPGTAASSRPGTSGGRGKSYVPVHAPASPGPDAAAGPAGGGYGTVMYMEPTAVSGYVVHNYAMDQGPSPAMAYQYYQQQ